MVNQIESLLVKKDDLQTFVLYRSVDFSLMIFFSPFVVVQQKRKISFIY